MRARISWFTAMLGLAVLAVAAVPDAHAAFALRGGVMGNGGVIGANANHTLRGTAGQASVGVSANAQNILCHGFWCFGGVRVVDVDQPDLGDVLPDKLEFGLPRPNPAIGVVTLSVALPEAADIDLAVFDVQGRQVGRVFAGRLEAGFHRLSWDARTGRMGAGVYFARLLVDRQLIGQHRVVMMR